jgi:nucleoside-diphosphate-sugar epimerase
MSTSFTLSEFYCDKKVLITGGCGFVGSHLTRALLAFRANVTIVDLDTSAERTSLFRDLGQRERLTLEQGDITNADLMSKLFAQRQFDYVFHLASYATAIERAVENPYATIQSNTLGTVNILEAIRLIAPDLRPKGIVITSTDKVYGDMDGQAYEEERTPLRGIGVYDSAKLAADVFTRTYHEVFGLPTTVLRMCNIFGPNDLSEYRLVPKAMLNIFGKAAPEAPELYFEALEHDRDYLFVEDAVRALLLLASSPQCRGDVYNLLACRALSTPEMLKAIVQCAAAVEELHDPDRARLIRTNGIRVNGFHAPTGPTKKVITIKKQHLNGEKIRRAISFTPEIPFEVALAKTVEAYRALHLARRGRASRQGGGPDVAITPFRSARTISQIEAAS